MPFQAGSSKNYPPVADCILSIFNDMGQCSAESVAQMLSMVSPERKAQALAYRHLPGQFACLKSHVMLKELLASEYGITHFTVQSAVHGKPYLTSHPGIHFNISHCKTAIAVAVSTAPVGIDIESIRKPTPALIERTMNPGESRLILDSADPARQFTRLWTRKESVFKLTGTGITDDIREILSIQTGIGTETSEKEKYILSISQFC